MWYNEAMDDLEFVHSCVKGDKQAWDRFVDKYSRLIYSCIYNILGTKDYAFAQSHIQDIFQEFFCFLIRDNFKKLKSFQAKNGCSLASWLRQVIINFTIDYLRKIKPALSLDEENEESLSLKDILADKSSSAPDILSQKERLSKLKECIDTLSDDDKYFLELAVNQGIEPEVLAKHLRRRRPAIDMRKSRIIERLRECFRSKGFMLPLS